MNKERLEEIKKLPLEEAIKSLDKWLVDNPADEEVLIERGLVYWKACRRREAINDYLLALNINPQGRARMLLEYANTILDFYNKDLLNP